MIIYGKNIILRDLEDSDAKDLAKNANNKEVSCYTFLPYPYKLNDAKKFISKAKTQNNLKNDIYLAIEVEGKLAGSISLNKISYEHKKAYIALWLGKKYWFKGYGKEALSLLVDYAFNKIGLKKVNAIIIEANKNSLYLLKKLGFKVEGKQEHYAILNNKTHSAYFLGKSAS